MKRYIGLLVIGILLLAVGCSQAEPAPSEPSPSEPVPAEEKPVEEIRSLPPEPTPPAPAPPSEPEVVEEPEEELLPGYAKLGFADSTDAIEIKDWGIEVGRGDSAKLVNVTFLIRNTGREPITGQILFEVWEESIFFKKTYSIDRDVPPGQSYFFTEYMEQTLDAPKRQKQMRAVFINVDAGEVVGEDHVFFVPIGR